MDVKIKNGDSLGKLFGCIVSVKDVISLKGHKLSAASKILEGYVAPYDATVIKNLLAEDSIIIGKTNCDEFGMGSANENSIYGICKNGIDPTRSPGGSSGGAAVSVQMNTCLIALGSDTGGSVRQPAAFCGVVGLKPSYGRVSRYGLIAYASSFDQIGIIGNTCSDISKVFDVIAGKDPLDATSSSVLLSERPKSNTKKIAYFKSMVNHEKLNPQIKSAFDQTTQKLEIKGYSVESLDFSFLDYLVPTYYVLTTAEASTNLSRYDGVRYGYRSMDADTLHDMYINTRSEGFGKEVKRRIMLGTYVLSEGYFDAYFKKAQQVRQLIKAEIDKVLNAYDYIILPVTTDVAWKTGTNIDNPVEVYLSDVFTVLANLTGLPAVSIPNGLNTDGMPIAVQLMGKKYSEVELLELAETIL